MKKDIRIRNVIFPFWLLWILPPVWLIIVPANIIIDGLVLYFTNKKLKVKDIGKRLKETLPKTVLIGFISDILASLPLLFIMVGPNPEYDTALGAWWKKNIIPIMYNPFESIVSFIIVCLCILLGGILIFQFNKRFVYKKLEMDEGEKFILARNMAIFTAPYLFLIPSSIFK